MSDPTTEIVLQAILDHLDRQAMSVSKAAEAIGCSRPYLQNVLTGMREPTLDWAMDSAEKLGIRVTLRVKMPPKKNWKSDRN